MDLLLIFVVSLFATLMSSMSGGGASIVTTPTWLLLGYSLPVTIASNLFAGSFWTVIAARNYLKNTEIEWPLIVPLVILGVIGSCFGVLFVQSADVMLFTRIFGGIILFLVLFTYFKKKFGVEKRAPEWEIATTALLGLPIGAYETSFGTGNGVFTTLLLCKTRGYDIIQALGTYYLLACPCCIVGVSLLAYNGNYDLSLSLTACLGGAIGSQLGSHIGSKKGSAFVKGVFILVGTFFGIKLLLGW